jgi:sirohydrochlorin ferrochelatase
MLGEAERIVQERYQAGQPTWRNPTESTASVWYSASIGNEPHLADVILERVREAAWISRGGAEPRAGSEE